MDAFYSVNRFRPSEALRLQLEKAGFLKTFKEGDVLLEENRHIQAIPMVVKGSLKVVRTDEDGREILLYYLSEGESCVMSFLGGMHHETSKVKAVVEEDTEVLFLPVEKISSLIHEYPEWLDYIFRLYHKRFEELLEVVNEVAFMRMDERLVELLHKKTKQGNSRELHVTHEQLANELGTSREVVSRLLKQLENLGKVALGRNRIHLL